MPTTQDEAASIIRIFGEEGVSPARVAKIAQRLTAEVGEPSDNDSVKQTMRMLSAIASSGATTGSQSDIGFRAKQLQKAWEQLPAEVRALVTVKERLHFFGEVLCLTRPEYEIKSWGESIPLCRDDVAEIVRVKIKHGGFSSLHLHERKHNLFIVLSGTLQVKVHEDDALRTLRSNKFLKSDTPPLLVPAGTLHRFFALDDVEAVEVYVSSDGTPVEAGDIVRQDEGGKVDVALCRREALKAQ